jgi:predicted nucleic acid-binding protein
MPVVYDYILEVSIIKVYLDNCAYNRPFDDQSQIRISLETQAKLFIQRCVINNEIELIYSYMSIYENSENPKPEHRNSILSFFRYAMGFIDINKADIIEERAESFKKWNIKSNDAIHLACAVTGNCEYFITTDDGILKNYHGQDIHVCSPLDFVSEVYNA